MRIRLLMFCSISSMSNTRVWIEANSTKEPFFVETHLEKNVHSNKNFVRTAGQYRA